MPANVLLALQFITTTAVCETKSSLVRRSGLLLAQGLLLLCEGGMTVAEVEEVENAGDTSGGSKQTAQSERSLLSIIQCSGKIDGILSTVTLPTIPVFHLPHAETTAALLKAVLSCAETVEADGSAALDMLAVRVYGAVPDIIPSGDAKPSVSAMRARSDSTIQSEHMLAAVHQLLHVCCVLSTDNVRCSPNYALCNTVMKACAAAPLGLSWRYVRYITQTVSETQHNGLYNVNSLNTLGISSVRAKQELVSTCISSLRLSAGNAALRSEVIQWAASTIRTSASSEAGHKLQSDVLAALAKEGGWVQVLVF